MNGPDYISDEYDIELEKNRIKEEESEELERWFRGDRYQRDGKDFVKKGVYKTEIMCII